MELKPAGPEEYRIGWASFINIPPEHPTEPHGHEYSRPKPPHAHHAITQHTCKSCIPKGGSIKI